MQFQIPRSISYPHFRGGWFPCTKFLLVMAALIAKFNELPLVLVNGFASAAVVCLLCKHRKERTHEQIDRKPVGTDERHNVHLCVWRESYRGRSDACAKNQRLPKCSGYRGHLASDAYDLDDLSTSLAWLQRRLPFLLCCSLIVDFRSVNQCKD